MVGLTRVLGLERVSFLLGYVERTDVVMGVMAEVIVPLACVSLAVCSAFGMSGSGPSPGGGNESFEGDELGCAP